MPKAPVAINNEIVLRMCRGELWKQRVAKMVSERKQVVRIREPRMRSLRRLRASMRS
jgi:hypothetical protein